MWQKIDTMLTIRPENSSPTTLADCFLPEKTSVRSISLCVASGIVLAKIAVVAMLIITIFQI